MPQLQSGVGTMAKNGRLTWPALIQSLCSAVPQFDMFPWHHKCSVPLALSEFSAPGSLNVQCPWHFQCSVPLALSQKFTVHLSSPAQVDSGTTSLYRLPVCLRMELELPSLLWFSFHSPHSPFKWSGLWQDRSQCPPVVTGQSPPAQIVTALMVYVMALCTAWCQPVSLTVNVICLQVFFCGKKSFVVWLLVSATSQPTCVNWWCCLSWGWLAMSPSSSALHWYV